MSMRCAGLLCTLLLIGAVAGLFGCMSAARCRRRAFAVCLLAVLLDFASLAALLSRLPVCDALSPAPWMAVVLLLTAFSLFAAGVLLHGRGRRLYRFPLRRAATICPARCALRGKTGSPA